MNEAEKWIITLIRDSGLDAKINSEENCVIMGKKNVSIHQQIMNSTKSLTEATYILADGVRSMWEEKEREVIGASRRMPPSQVAGNA